MTKNSLQRKRSTSAVTKRSFNKELQQQQQHGAGGSLLGQQNSDVERDAYCVGKQLQNQYKPISFLELASR
jgi:hypothetical protein